ncbi:MAG: His/Gly/Thr/Pro-type tRNA ligase C-terminal domain-containing protein, partial [Lentisphaeria bacterium]|nr:His/Gly/Thr/Pro-type tRNA ligase C-terminal domain-containing protein [Lentisphaeria bacterium]
ASYDGRPVEVELDSRDLRGGEKVWHWIKNGIPIRLEVGPRDVESDAVFAARRDRSHKDKQSIPRAEFIGSVADILAEIQDGLFERAVEFRAANTVNIDSKDEFYDFFTPQNRDKPEIHGGFAMCHWNGKDDVEEQLKNDLNVTIRCIPNDAEAEAGTCVISGEPSQRRVIFAKSY